MTIWVDADAAPGEMKEVIFRAGKRLGLAVRLVANRSVEVPVAYPFALSICVRAGADAADHYIAEHAQARDVVVTADIALAAALVQKAVAVVDPRGTEYTRDNAAERLSVRNFMEGLRGAGATTGGPPPYDARAKRAFAATLDRVLTREQRRK